MRNHKINNLYFDKYMHISQPLCCYMDNIISSVLTYSDKYDMIMKKVNIKGGNIMPEYLDINSDKENISLVFYIENKNIMEIGSKIERINSDAYMNGYNWEAFLNYYLQKQSPDVLENMDSDPEAGMYIAYYENVPENVVKVNKLEEIIEYLIENPDDIYEIVREHGNEIEWD